MARAELGHPYQRMRLGSRSAEATRSRAVVARPATAATQFDSWLPPADAARVTATFQAAGLRAYGRVLRHGPAVRPFTAAVIARLPIAMAPLGTILLVQDVRGAYGIAGLVTGAYALGTAVGSPVWGRRLDRFGQPWVVAPTALVSAGLLAALALSTVAGAGNAVLLALAAASGLTFPPVGPAMRAAWRVVLRHEVSRRAGSALDASAVEAIFVGGPLLLSLLLVVSPPVVPLLVTAALLAGGGVAYSLTGAARAYRPVPIDTADQRRAGRHPARGRLPGSAVSAPGVTAVLVVMTAMSVGFGQLDTSLAATAVEVLENRGRLGILFAAIAGGSVVGGLCYGALHWTGPEHRRLPVTLTTFAAALVPIPILVAAGHAPLVLLLPLLFVAGLSIAPSLIMAQNMLDELAPAHRVNEAQSLLTAAATSGAAAGTAAAGALVDIGGPPWSFSGAAVAVAAAALLAATSQCRWAAAATEATSAACP